jgi:redox-sensitive bicupin YhaK (pirin superfamily)
MIENVIEQRRRDLGGFEVGRVLPHAKRRMVGPFVFFDHMGPVDFPPGIPRSVDVRPHPHIGLSTITYLFDGEITPRQRVRNKRFDWRSQLDDGWPRHHPFGGSSARVWRAVT